MQESRKQNVMPYEQTRVTINDLLTPSRAIVRVACELLTSLEMSIVNKQWVRYISLFCQVTYVEILHTVL